MLRPMQPPSPAPGRPNGEAVFRGAPTDPNQPSRTVNAANPLSRAQANVQQPGGVRPGPTASLKLPWGSASLGPPGHPARRRMPHTQPEHTALHIQRASFPKFPGARPGARLLTEKNGNRASSPATAFVQQEPRPLASRLLAGRGIGRPRSSHGGKLGQAIETRDESGRRLPLRPSSI